MTASKKATITYRGWPGHFIMGDRCVFHLNTLVEVGNVRVVVSTVGNMRVGEREAERKAEEIGLSRYYETMAFHAKQDENGYWDADVEKHVPVHSRWTVDHIGAAADAEAQAMHEVAVVDIAGRIKSGEIA